MKRNLEIDSHKTNHVRKMKKTLYMNQQQRTFSFYFPFFSFLAEYSYSLFLFIFIISLLLFLFFFLQFHFFIFSLFISRYTLFIFGSFSFISVAHSIDFIIFQICIYFLRIRFLLYGKQLILVKIFLSKIFLFSMPL